MKIKKIIAILILFLVFPPTLKATDLLDTATAKKLFTLGVRVGFNTSNNTFPNTALAIYNYSGWGLGFTGGVVANINIKEYFSIQPGLFLDIKSNRYTMLYWYKDYATNYQEYWCMGSSRNFNFTVPVMAIMKFGVTDNLKFTGEIGPYIQLKMKQTGYDIDVPYQLPQTTLFDSYLSSRNNMDFGFKLGAGILAYNHFYLGIHYLAGFCNSWKLPAGGHNKEWTFTLGYDF